MANRQRQLLPLPVRRAHSSFLGHLFTCLGDQQSYRQACLVQREAGELFPVERHDSGVHGDFPRPLYGSGTQRVQGRLGHSLFHRETFE